MTTIGVKYHNEDIHNIIRKPMSPTIKSPRYKSKSIYKSDFIYPTGKANIAGANGEAGVVSLAFRKYRKYNGHQTFGLAHYKAPEAKNFLKKGSGRVFLAPRKLINKKEFTCTINCKSSSIPKHSFESRKQARKNFVKENIKKAAALQPKVPVPKKVETPRGTVKDLAHLLQMIKIRQSEEYGKIPKYLHVKKEREEKIKKKQELEMQAIKEYNEKLGTENLETTKNVYMIDSETRQKILDGLKENWNELSKQFLKLPVMTDTWPKIKRKMWLEKEIEQLEKDIRLVESHPYIYLERQAEGSHEVVPENTSQSNIQKPEQEIEITEKLEKDQTGQPTTQLSAEDTTEEKKEEDKEINILEY